MSSLVAVRSNREASVELGLRAAPHRGDQRELTSLGEVTIGVSSWTSSPDTKVALAHGLLAALVGHLGNRVELATELGLAKETGASDVLLHAWRRWNRGTPARLRGEFAATISDGRDVWFFRDHFGFGTLFFRTEGPDVFVASEAKQVAAAAGISRDPDLDALERLFWGRSEDGEPPCTLAGVERVPRSNLMHWGHDLQMSRFWDPADLVETLRMDIGDAVEQTRHVLDQAVRRSLTGRDAVSLSGGIDSTTIAAVAAPQHLAMFNRPLVSISTVYPHAKSVDESEYIAMVVSRLGLESHTFVPGYRRLQDVERWVDLLDGPGSPAAYPALEEFLRVGSELGVTNVLLGDLAEFIYDVRDHVLGHLLATGKWATARRHWVDRRNSGREFGSLARETAISLMPSALSGSYSALRKRTQTPLVGWAYDSDSIRDTARRHDLEAPVRQRWRSMQTWFAMGPSSHSIEAFAICAEYCRSQVLRPLNDVDLVEFFIGLPAHLKFPDGQSKSLIRRTMRGSLPDEVLDRAKKTSFNEDTLSRVDYQELKRLIFGSEYRMPGVDYAMLKERLDTEQMGFWELRVAHNLADYHAFAALWE